MVLGLGVLLIPVVGSVLVVKEVQFGLATQRLARRLEAEGGLPVDDLPRRASGRVDRAAADQAFERYRVVVEAHPDDWGAWYRLGVAYDDSGDRRRARSSMRQAIALEQAQSDKGCTRRPRLAAVSRRRPAAPGDSSGTDDDHQERCPQQQGHDGEGEPGRPGVKDECGRRRRTPAPR